MEIFRSIRDITPRHRDCVIAIGNFDGVHRGHCALIAEARKIAQASGKNLGVLTFEPHPRSIFRPDDPPFRLTPPDIKAERLGACGIDCLISLDFDWDFASMTPDVFIQRILRDALGAAHIVVGNDFGFGQMRRGDAGTLISSGLPVTVFSKIDDDGEGPLSSSAIRQALRAGDIAHANDLLGWAWEIRGVVQVGDRRGRELGYPTANVPLRDTLHPSYGVYASYARIVENGPDAPWMPSATNIGIRPMFALPQGQVETYIFDFNSEIYGKTLCVRPVRKLRGEAKFESLEALIRQIGMDCEEARAILL